MSSPHESVLCRYHYDPLDRLAATTPMGQADVRRFYQKSRLATEIQGAMQRTVFQHGDQLLAQQQRLDAAVETSLLATDQQRSVLQFVDKTGTESVVYNAYGHHHPADSGLSRLLGFTGERRDPVTGHYLLGNGYRAFNPVLMRFNSPDSLSPFGEGGLNAYAYCQGDPVNFKDPTGHSPRGADMLVHKYMYKLLSRARLKRRAFDDHLEFIDSGKISLSRSTSSAPVTPSSSGNIGVVAGAASSTPPDLALSPLNPDNLKRLKHKLDVNRRSNIFNQDIPLTVAKAEQRHRRFLTHGKGDESLVQHYFVQFLNSNTSITTFRGYYKNLTDTNKAIRGFEDKFYNQFKEPVPGIEQLKRPGV